MYKRYDVLFDHQLVHLMAHQNKVWYMSMKSSPFDDPTWLSWDDWAISKLKVEFRISCPGQNKAMKDLNTMSNATHLMQTGIANLKTRILLQMIEVAW